MSRLTEAELASIESVTAAATPGPWDDGYAIPLTARDKAFIFTARAVMPRLLAEVRYPQPIQGEADQLHDKVQELRADLARVTAERDAARAEITVQQGYCDSVAATCDRLRQERADAMSVTSRDGLLSSEWVLRTGQAERRVAELEALCWRLTNAREDSGDTALMGQASENHLRRELRASVEAAERKRGERRG